MYFCQNFIAASSLRTKLVKKLTLKTRGLLKDFILRPRHFGVALSNVAFASWQTQKVKCYMNFSGPEKFFKLNLWPHLRSSFDFSHLLSDKFYRSKHFVKQTWEKVDLKNARPSQRFYFAPAAFRSCAEQRSFCELANAKSKMLYEFFWSREKVDLKNARPSQRFYFAPAAFRSCAEQRSFCELANAKSKMLYEFFGSREIF